MEDKGLQLGGEGANKHGGESKKKKIISIVVLIIGLITLVAGVVFLVLKLNQTPAVADGEYLVSVGSWTLDGGDAVVWDFTEIGKGTLTTDGNANNYDFIWALEDGKLVVETNWLYTLNNEYEYEINQSERTLTLKSGEDVYKFTAKFEN